MPTINQLSRLDPVSDADLFVVYSSGQGDPRAVSGTTLKQFVQSNITSIDGFITQYASPSASGFSVLINNGLPQSQSVWLILTPTADFAAGTIILPFVDNCVNGQEVLVNCSRQIASFTLNGNGASVSGVPTTIASNSFFTLRFDGISRTWYFFGQNAISTRTDIIPTNDSYTISIQNGAKSAFDIYGSIIPPGYFFYDGLRSTISLESGVTVQNANAFGAYISNNVAKGTAPNEKNAVGLFTVVVNRKAGAESFGINTTGTDSFDNTAPNSVASTIVGWEDDHTNYNAGTIHGGAAFIMQGTVAPAGANAVQVSISAGSVAKWTNSFVSNDGAAETAAIFGALSNGGTNIPGQPINLGIYDSAAAGHYVVIQAFPSETDSAIAFKDNIRDNGIFFELNSGTPLIGVTGAIADVNLGIAAKGAGAIEFQTIAVANPTAASGSNVSSLPIGFSLFNSVGTSHVVTATGVPLTTNSGLQFADTTLATGITIGFNASTPTIFSSGSPTDIDLALFAKGAGSITLNNPVVATAKFTGVATSTAHATFNIPSGTAPSAPIDGDIWREDNTNTGLKVRVNGVTKTVSLV